MRETNSWKMSLCPGSGIRRSSNDPPIIPNLPPENGETKGSRMEAVFWNYFPGGGLDAGETAFRNLKK